MRRHALLPGILAALAAGSADGRTPGIDQGIPPALIGAWKVSLAESRFPAGRAPKTQYRIFETTQDGKLLGHYLSASANGVLSGGHWISPLDGRWSPEFVRAGGAALYAMVRYVRSDASTLEMQATRQGVRFETGRFELAPDGRTLTVTFHVDGASSVAVYHPWNLVD